MRRGVLIIQSMGLGDLVFSLPAVRALKHASPQEPITFLTHENYAGLLSLIPEIDSVITYKSKSLPALISLTGKIRRPRFSKVFVLNPIFRGSLLAWISGAPERIGYLKDYEGQQSAGPLGKIMLTHSYFPENKKRHEVDRYLDLLESYGVKAAAEDRDPQIKITDSSLSQYPLPERGKKEAVIINLGTGWINRRWPEKSIVQLAQELLGNYDCRLYFCGGASEAILAKSMLEKIGGRAVDLCGKTTLPQLTAYLAQCRLFISSDTGSLHIASALGTPSIGLFGPGDLEKVKPRSGKTEVLYHPMPCSPCRFQYTDLCAENLCMKEITVAEVMEAVQTHLGPLRSTPVHAPFPEAAVKKKILYLQSTSEVGGTDVTLLRTLDALNKTAYEPHVLIPKEGPFSEAYRHLGCKVHVMPSMRKMTKRRGIGYLFLYLAGYFPAVLGIAALIKKESIDLVHTNTMHNLYGFLAAKIAGVPHLWHIREIVMQSSWMKRLEIFLVKHFSARFIVMDNAISEMFLGRHSGYPKNIVKLYDGVDLQKFNPEVSGKRIREELGIPPENPLIGTVGRLDPWKGLDALIDAATLIHAQRPDAHFLFCGGEIEGHEGYETKLHGKIRSFGLENRIHITGWKYFGADIPEVYRAMTLSVQCPAYPEPYGLANIEAMASGIPTVAVREGGPVELCADQKTGFLVAPGNSKALADAVLTLLNDPEQAIKMGAEGRKRAETLFDYQLCTRNLEALYADILRLTGPGPITKGAWPR